MQKLYKSGIGFLIRVLSCLTFPFLLLFVQTINAQSNSKPTVTVSTNTKPAEPQTNTIAVPPPVDYSIYYGDKNIVGYMREQFEIENIFISYPDFPHFIDTGDKDTDCRNYQSRVLLWIRGNEKFIEKYKGKL